MTAQIETIPTDEETCGCGSWEHTSDLSVIRHDVWELKEKVQELINLIEPVQEELGPMLDAFSKSPIAKMLGVGQ
ncbi:MAG TPA: hypothetical protein VIY48_16165 [Candidatus Paceibacterota bacterium]